jgi:hypothetical protein
MTLPAATARRFPWRTYLIVLAVIVVIGAFPLYAVLIAEWISYAHGCGPILGPPVACVISDDMVRLGEGLIMAAWSSVVFVPLGAVALLVWLGVLIARLLVWKRKQGAPT